MAEPEVGGRETERKEGVGRRLSLMLSTAASRSCPGVVLVAWRRVVTGRVQQVRCCCALRARRACMMIGDVYVRSESGE